MGKSFVFAVGVVAGGLIAAAVMAGMYYHRYYVELDGPAQPVMEEFARNGLLVRNVFTDRPEMAEGYAAENALLSGLGAARIYCHMNKWDKRSVHSVANKLESTPLFMEYVAGMDNKGDGSAKGYLKAARSALDYLAHASPEETSCVVFRS